MQELRYHLSKVLCPVDVTHQARAKPQLAVSWQLASKCEAELDCLFVNPFYDTYAGYGPYLDGSAYSDIVQSVSPVDLIQEDKKKLKLLLAEAGVPVVHDRVSYECQVGPVFSTVNDWIGAQPKKLSDGLIVITKSESSGFSDFVLGSLATRLIRTAQMPCLVIPENKIDENWVPQSVIIGFSLDNPGIVEQPFISLLTKLGCKKVTIVHAFKREPVLQAAESYRLAVNRSDDVMYSLIEDNIRHRLETAVETLPSGFAERNLFFDQGKPEDVIFSACASSDPKSTLLILGRSAPATELGYLGSTLQHLVSAAEVPVLVLPFQ